MSDQHTPHSHPTGDVFTRAGEDIADLLEANWKLLVGVMVMVIAVGTGVIMYQRSAAKDQANLQGKVAEIAAGFPGASGSMVMPGSAETAILRYEALLGKASGPARYTALMYLGQAYQSVGKADEARARYEELTKGPALFAAMGHMRLGYLAADAADYPAAVAAFQKAASLDAALAVQAKMDAAYVAEASGDSATAITRYTELIKGHPDFVQAREAESRIRVLGGDPDVLLGRAKPTPPALFSAPTGTPEMATPAPAKGTGKK
ncbi:MAG: tetratricopeptide repeat protein [Nitrospirota bacterium]|nr:tetratricopeptide repeat protein [Nitrospirota bacterium]